MSATLQHLIVRMLHDPTFRAAVYANPEAALGDEGLTAHEHSMLLAVDQRAYAVDADRADRVLSALIEEHPVSVLALFHDGYTLDHLRTFFASPLFHHAVATGQSLAPAFGEHLARLAVSPSAAVVARLASSPRARALVAFERALALLRRARPVPTQGIIVRAPHVASVALAEGTLAAWQAGKTALGAEPLVRLLDTPPALSDVHQDRTEFVLLERAVTAEIAVSDIDAALHRLLEFAAQPRTFDELYAYLERSGEAECDAEGIIDDLLRGELLVGRFRPGGPGSTP